jgi:hypothetical protein
VNNAGHDVTIFECILKVCSTTLTTAKDHATEILEPITLPASIVLVPRTIVREKLYSLSRSHSSRRGKEIVDHVTMAAVEHILFNLGMTNLVHVYSNARHNE